jgi:hypothetical protein
MPSSARTPDKREFVGRTAFPQRRNQTSFDSARGRTAGKRSWEKRSPELKVKALAALEAKADRAKGGQALVALKASDPDTALWLEISRLRAIAISRGEVPPGFFKVVPLEAPALIKTPGRKERKRVEKMTKPEIPS